MSQASTGDLVEKLKGSLQTTKKDCEVIVKHFVAAVKELVEEQGSVSIHNFGTFKTVERAARKGRNPRTGEEIQIEASTSVSFKAAAGFKAGVASEE